MLTLILICSWLLIGLLSGAAATYWIDKEDIILKDMVFLSCLGVVTLIAAIMYVGAEFIKGEVSPKLPDRLKKFWNKTLIKR